MKAQFLVVVSTLALSLTACGEKAASPIEAPAAAASVDTARLQAVLDAEAAEQAAEAARQAELARNKQAIEAVLVADTNAGRLGSADATARAMRAIDLSGAPGDFQSAYVAHIQAWEREAELLRQWRELTSDDRQGAAVAAGVICGLLDCPARPIGDQIDSEAAMKRQIATASEQISESFRQVERIAALYGAQRPGTPV